MSTNETPHSGFDIGKQLSMAVSICGVLLMLGHLAGQLREGSASGWSLIVGAACFVGGLIFTLLFLVLIRLHRIEQHLPVSGNSEPPNEEGGLSDSKVVQPDHKTQE